MKRRNLIIGASTGGVAGIAGGIVVFRSLYQGFFGGFFSLQGVLSNPYLLSSVRVLIIFSALLGLVGGLISGLIGRTKTALLLGAILGFCLGCAGGILAFLGFMFS